MEQQLYEQHKAIFIKCRHHSIISDLFNLIGKFWIEKKKCGGFMGFFFPFLSPLSLPFPSHTPFPTQNINQNQITFCIEWKWEIFGWKIKHVNDFVYIQVKTVFPLNIFTENNCHFSSLLLKPLHSPIRTACRMGTNMRAEQLPECFFSFFWSCVLHSMPPSRLSLPPATEGNKLHQETGCHTYLSTVHARPWAA